jgi:CRP-like cAMP-binding protein
MPLPFLKKFSDDEIKAIFIKSETMSFLKGEYLFHDGDLPNYLDLLIEGELQVFTYDHNSIEVTLNYIEPISLLAEIPSLFGYVYPANGRFSIDSKIMRMSMPLLKQSIQTDISLNQFLIDSLCEKIKTLNFSLNSGLTQDSKKK